jgi:dipeptidyl aminopeptidase/acylaminoacyl peptidase
MLALLLAAAPVSAQVPAQERPPRPVTVQPSDYADWERLGQVELSPDGAWIAWVVNRVDADDVLYYRRTAAAPVPAAVVPVGYAPRFSPDGRWLAYMTGVPRSDAVATTAIADTVATAEDAVVADAPVVEDAAVADDTAAGADDTASVGRRRRPQAAIVNLETGVTTVLADVASVSFSADSRFAALRRFPPDDGTDRSGTVLIVRRLESGDDVPIADVVTHAWRGMGAVLALVVADSSGREHGVRVHDAGTGALRSLIADTLPFRSLTWRGAADDLAVMRSHGDDDSGLHDVLGWRSASGAQPRLASLPAELLQHAAEPVRVVTAREPEWSDDGQTLFLGVREMSAPAGTSTGTDVPDPAAADTAGVEVWHSRDVDIVPAQRVEALVDHSRSRLAAWHVDSGRFVVITRHVLEQYALSDGAYAVAADPRPHAREAMFGPVYRDIFAVHLPTGARTLIAARVHGPYSISPSGRYVLYFREGAYHTFNTETGRRTNITAGVPTSFVNVEHDHTADVKPVWGTGGWLSDDRHVLLHDRHDVWIVAADGTSARNATNGAADGIRHRRIWLTPDHRVVDASRPFYVSLHGETTKQTGYGRVLPGGGHETLLLRDASIGRLGRARDADVYVYREESFTQSPNWHVSGPRLTHAVRISDTNPFQQQYDWGRAEVIDFTSATGRPLQAALFYPAGHVEGVRYPMIVHPYETTSNLVHTYVPPSEFGEFNTTVFSQNGYFVLRPDVSFRARDPGLSAVESLVPAVRRVVGMGLVDSTRVGLAGHSWGGYQAAFAVTQTDAFAAAVASAPLTNLVSMYFSVFENMGMPNARIFEVDQGRMQVPFWEDVDAYLRNSPVFAIRQLDAPLLVAFGTDDGAVNFNQGVELYNAARRAGRELVLLVYEGEGHSISRRPNQRDLHRRVLEWFGHYLKDEPAPGWMTRP